MESISSEFLENDKRCDECHIRPAKWVENSERPYNERVYLCHECAREYQQNPIKEVIEMLEKARNEDVKHTAVGYIDHAIAKLRKVCSIHR